MTWQMGSPDGYDISGPALIDSVSASETDSPIKRQRRSPELKLKIVEESLAPAASVARIARAHGVNANQVFKWRRQYQQGLLSGGKMRKNAMPGLLAVRVTTPQDVGHSPGSAPMPAFPSGTIQIELAKGTIRIRGQADVDVLRTALEVLAR
jgi:transposase